MKDIVFKRAGMLVNRLVPITVLGDATQIVVVDVSRNAVGIVLGVCPVQVLARVRHIAAVVLDVELKEVVHHLVSMIVIRTVLGGAVDPFVALMQQVHVKPTAVSIAWQHLVLPCVKMHVVVVVQHVSIRVDSNAVLVRPNVLLDVEQLAISHALDIANIHVTSIVFILAVSYAVDVLSYATHVLVCA